jgi:hypothetical protein
VPLNHWPVVKSPSTKLHVNGPLELAPPSLPPLGALPDDAPEAEPLPPPVSDALPEPAPDAGVPVGPTSEPLIVLGLPLEGTAPLALLTPLLPTPLPVPGFPAPPAAPEPPALAPEPVWPLLPGVAEQPVATSTETSKLARVRLRIRRAPEVAMI